MSDRLKIGLIGAGVFAGYHANKLTEHPSALFTGVVDRDAVAAENLAKRHNIKPMSLTDLFAQSEAVVIASPASTHGAIAIQALEAGCHCLIEKPIATTASEAEKIASLAADKKLTVQVGHQERLIFHAVGLMELGVRPLKIQAVRNSKYSKRGTDTSVTMDLMTHDIDLCTALMGAAPEAVSGQAKTIRSDHPDMSWARLSYGETTAVLESRIFKWVGLGLLAVLILLVALNWSSIKRLQTVNSLFDADKIVENFSNMDAAFLHHDLTIGEPVPWPEDIQPLPETVMIAGGERNLAEALEELDTTALVIIRDGKLIHESYYKGTGRDDLRISWSVAKSFLSGLYGQAIKDGLMDISNPIETYLPQLKGTAYEGATVANILNMSRKTIWTRNPTSTTWAAC